MNDFQNEDDGWGCLTWDDIRASTEVSDYDNALYCGSNNSAEWRDYWPSETYEKDGSTYSAELTTQVYEKESDGFCCVRTLRITDANKLAALIDLINTQLPELITQRSMNSTEETNGYKLRDLTLTINLEKDKNGFNKFRKIN